MKDKNEIREQIRALRDTHDKRLREEKNVQIAEALQKQKEFMKAKTICIYLSKGSEVETHELVKKIFKEGKKKVVVPVTDVKSKQIVLSLINDLNDTKKSTYDILEPKKMLLIQPEQVDIFIVPGIAFDSKGSRIGYGQGYYDKLLSTTKKPKVGLAYSFQMVESIFTDTTDIAMDKVITEEEVYGKNT
ncbi:MAG TPA: 5-formyltetrahydrofolate cyclo-ligase [Candidatus Nanoarchaeia archaeon]|nr:5-formyltetrahydrofolate cyclo-ligase [Candidatus Nanoarchaeia archaeon]